MDKNQFISVSLKNNHIGLLWLAGFVLCYFGTSLCGFSQTFSGKSNSLEIEIADPELSNKTAKPTIRWVYPSENVTTVNKEFVNLKLGINSKSPVVKVTLVVNNEVVEIFENFSNADTGYLFDAWMEKTVRLQTGSNDLQLIVQNEQGALKHQRKIEVAMSPSFRRDHALIFGCDEYDTFDDLIGPVRDSDRLGRVLEEKGFNIEIVRNSTTFDLLGKLEEYVVKEFQPHDQLFIYFAGHGHFDAASGEGYLVCKNSVNIPNASTYISYSAIKSIVNNIPAQHIFMLMDAVKGRGEALSSILLQLQEQPVDSNSTVAISEEGKTRLSIFSGTTSYQQGTNYNAGSALSRAFVTYLRKSELTEYPTRKDLLMEFEGIEPDPVYKEFGDHSSDKGFTLKQTTSEN